jgi:6-pyruvoyltetrahydropterin/6-carboxytetrahydropterin synthase
MFRLTREVRFAINASPDAQLSGRPSNSYGGFPSLTGLGYFFALEVTLAGEPQVQSQYVRNIKEIDDAVRRLAIPYVERRVQDGSFGGGAGLAIALFDLLAGAFPGAELAALQFNLSPFLAYRVQRDEHSPEKPMVRLSQKFEFSATHRLHNPALNDEANRQTFGKCNNPHGHGHNYEVQVTIAGTPDANGLVMDIPCFERLVAETVIDRLDHKNLNVEVPEFRETIPSVENIARVIYSLLKPKFVSGTCKLASVTVWETPKTCCEYSE